MKKTTALAMVFCALILAACSFSAKETSTPDVAATVNAAVAATDAARPPAIPVQVTVEVPVTVLAPQTVVVTATPLPASPIPPAPATQTPVAGAATPTTAPIVTGGGPDPLANASGVLFEEDFVQPDFWGTGEGDVSKFALADGRLVATLKEPGHLAWALNGISGSNFYVQATVVSGACRAGDYYGLVFRAVDEANLYFFGISCDGKFKVLKDEKGDLSILSDLVFNAAIKPLNAVNVIGVRADGGQLSFYANNAFLGTLTDGTFAEGDFGVGLRSFQTEGPTVEFDDVKAWVIQH